MKYFEKHPFSLILVGIVGISLSAIFVKYSTAPSALTALWRLAWTVALMTPAVFITPQTRRELTSLDRKSFLLSLLSGVFLAVHFLLWFESLRHTSVASSATLVCTEVIWVSLGFVMFMGGKISPKAVLTIAAAFAGSAMIALSDSGSEGHLYGDVLALLAAVSSAVYMLIGRIVQKRTSTTVYTYVLYWACAVCLLILCLGQGIPVIGSGSNAMMIGLMLSVFSTILGHSIFSWSLKFFSPSFVSACKLCEPVVASLLALVLFAEIPSAMKLLGGVVILGSVYHYSKLERAAEGERSDGR